jgi:hypothetical protein
MLPGLPGGNAPVAPLPVAYHGAAAPFGPSFGMYPLPMIPAIERPLCVEN